MSQIRPPEDQMPGRGIAYGIAIAGLIIVAIIVLLLYLGVRVF
ncbi:MAG: hypothetical protein ACK47B_13145 [Armatimonadota bacterium]